MKKALLAKITLALIPLIGIILAVIVVISFMSAAFSAIFEGAGGDETLGFTDDSLNLVITGKVTGDVITIDITGDITVKGIKATIKNGKFEIKSAGGSGVDTSTTQGKVWMTLKRAGFSDASAAGIMGNIQGESSFDSSYAIAGDYGLFNMNGKRASDMRSYVKKKYGTWTDPVGQVEWALTEIDKELKAYSGKSTYWHYLSEGTTKGYEKKYTGKKPSYTHWAWWPMEAYDLAKFKKITDVALATEVYMRCFERPSIPHLSNRTNASKGYLKKYGGKVGDTYAIKGTISRGEIKLEGTVNGRPLTVVTAYKNNAFSASVVAGNDYVGAVSGQGMVWPVPGHNKITSDYGPRWGKIHGGIDIGAPTGTPIVAAADGQVIRIGDSGGGGPHAVLIKHNDKLYTWYLHCSAHYVKEGQIVKRGQKIAAVGSLGYSTGPHLHFTVRVALKGYPGDSVDPKKYVIAPKK